MPRVALDHRYIVFWVYICYFTFSTFVIPDYCLNTGFPDALARSETSWTGSRKSGILRRQQLDLQRFILNADLWVSLRVCVRVSGGKTREKLVESKSETDRLDICLCLFTLKTNNQFIIPWTIYRLFYIHDNNIFSGDRNIAHVDAIVSLMTSLERNLIFVTTQTDQWHNSATRWKTTVKTDVKK